MASDLEERLAEEEMAKNPIGIPDCLVDMSRRIQEHGSGQVDNAAALSEDLTAEVQSKAFRLVVGFSKPGSIQLRPGYGQVGFIRKSRIPTSPGGTTTDDFSVIPVTAKRNLRRLENSSRAEEAAVPLDESTLS